MSSPAAPAAPEVRAVEVNAPSSGSALPSPRAPGRALAVAARIAGRGFRNAYRWLWMLHSRARAALLVASNPGPLRLCLGSGSAPIADWLNLDLEGRPDLRWDLRKPLPFASASVDRIYSEHFIEHLDHRDGASLLRDCRRLLKADGVLRIATPDLPALVEAYRGDWQDQDWLRWPGHEWIDSAAKMLNQCFQGWGHKFLYDAKELEGALTEAGFTEIRRCKIGESSHAELSGLETRLDSLLIFEAWGLKGAKE